MKKNKVLKAGLGYTIGNILIRGIGFLTVPIFSRLMSSEAFGIYNVFLAYQAILFIIIGMTLHSSVRSAYYEFEGEIDKYISSISLIYIINAGFLCIIVGMFGGLISPIVGLSDKILQLLILYSFACAIITLYNTKISLEYLFQKYLILSFINSFGSILLSLLLMFTVCVNDRAMGRIAGTTIICFLISVILVLAFYKKAPPRYNKKYWRFGIKYSLPIIPHGISQVLLAQFDRIMIQKMVGNSEAGIYSLAGNIKLILTVISESISTTWSTWFYSEMEKKNYHAIQLRAKQISILFLFFTVGLMACAPELLYILGGKEYDIGKYVAIPMIVDAFVLFIYNIIVPSEYYTQKTVYIMLGTMLAAVINVAMNYICISRYGFIAAAYTTLFAYVCYLVLHVIISYRLIHFFVLPIKWMLFCILIISIMAGIDIFFIDNIAIRWGLCAIAVLLIGFLLYRSYTEMEGKQNEKKRVDNK